MKGCRGLRGLGCLREMARGLVGTWVRALVVADVGRHRAGCNRLPGIQGFKAAWNTAPPQLPCFNSLLDADLPSNRVWKGKTAWGNSWVSETRTGPRRKVLLWSFASAWGTQNGLGNSVSVSPANTMPRDALCQETDPPF